MSQTNVKGEQGAEEATVGCIVVGLGGVTRGMLRFLSAEPWYQTRAVVDVQDSALFEAKDRLGLHDDELFTDMDEALASVDSDVVLVNTPSEWHYEQAKNAMEAGKHVLVAKPVANSFEEAADLVAVAQSQGVTLSVGQQMRYNRHYTAVHAFLQAGELGRPEMVNFLSGKPRHKALNLANMAQPTLFEMSCHHFDSLMSLFPDHKPQWIMCDGFRPSWSVYTGPCSINGLIRFDRDLHILYHAGFSAQADLYEVRIEGATGALRCRGIHMSNDEMEYMVAPRGGQWATRSLDGGHPPVSPWIPFLRQWHHYVVHGILPDGSEPPFSGRNNLRVMAMLSAGIESIESGQPVAIAEHPRFAAAFS